MPTDDADKRPGLIVTIDGPAGTGKSTVAHQLAGRLGLDFLDTGAMYRAAALLAIEEGIDPGDGQTLAAALDRFGLGFDWATDPPCMMLGDRDVSRRIRDLDVSEIVSIVAARPEIRRVLVAQQRAISAEHPRMVSEGRDQGSVVFPDAALRLYLDADVDVRAGRRAAQLEKAGMDVDHDRIARDIRERDRLDSTRRDGPLVKPRDAIEVDTSVMTVEEVVDELERLCRKHFPASGFRT